MKIKFFFPLILFLSFNNAWGSEIESNELSESEDVHQLYNIKWSEFTHEYFGDQVKVIGYKQGDSFFINVEKTLEDYQSVRGLYTLSWWYAAKALSFIGINTPYKVTDADIADMLGILSDFKFTPFMSYVTVIEGPFFAVSRTFPEDDDVRCETFSASFKQKHNDTTKIFLLAPSFAKGVEFYQCHDDQSLEDYLKGNGITLKYGIL